MPICVAGMHRSGTSLVAQLLNVCGVDFGPPEELLPANEFNRDGYWENRRFVELNDSLLEAAGGAWDVPLNPPAWGRLEAAALLRAEAEALLASLSLREPWGWKDPRNSLTISFWRDVLSELRVVVCVRHPLEVALSLRRRGAMSFTLGLRLWTAYNRSILDSVPREQRVVTHFDRYFSDAPGELQRVLGWLQLDVTDELLAAAVTRTQGNLRTEWQGGLHVGLADLPRDVRGLYLSLCAEADLLTDQVPQSDDAEAAALGTPAARANDGLPLDELAPLVRSRLRAEVEDLRRERDRWESEVHRLTDDRDRWRRAAERAEEAREATEAERERLRETADAERERLRAEADAEHERLRGAADRLGAEVAKLEADRDRWRSEADGLRHDRDNWQTEAGNWRREASRLLAWREARMTQRLRAAGFRSARRMWWALPRALRDFLRPIIFRTARTPRSATTRNTDPPEGSRSSEPARRARPRPSRQIDTPVSIVVPTLNGGRIFERLLRSISRQEGVPELELLVIDSGSVDETLELAERAKAHIVSIPQDEFRHGRTRNVGAALATGETIVMMVQDAILLGSNALRDLVLELHEDERTAAVSSRQVPRSDADLYAAFVVYAHYSAIWGANGARPSSGHVPLRRRAAASVDDVCAAVRRAAWEEIQFSDVDFAEDIDFGVRAVARGWSVKLSQVAAVAHSHTREPVYHLRRAIADRLYVAPLVGDAAVSLGASSGLQRVLAAGTVLLSEVQGATSLAFADEAPLLYQLAEIRRLIERGAPRLPPTGPLASLAPLLERGTPGADGNGALGHLRREFVALLEWAPLTAFVRAQRQVAAEPAARFVAGLSASVLGRVIGDALRVGADDEEATQFVAGV